MRQQVGYAIRIENTPECREKMVAAAAALGLESIEKAFYLHPGEEYDFGPPSSSARLGWRTPEDAQAALDFHIRKGDEFFGTAWRADKLFTIVRLTVIETMLDEA